MGTGAFGRTLLSEFANNSPRGASSTSEAVGGTQPAVLPCPPYIRWVSDRVVKLLLHFISDPTIIHADDGSPDADWIFERK